VATVFVTDTSAPVRHETEPSFVLALWSLGEERRVQMVLHGEAEGTLPQLIASSVGAARAETLANGIDIPSGAYAYFLGHRETGVRFLFGAKAG
jgi:hypothetical protein